MAVGPRCLVIVPDDAPELYARLVTAFLDDAWVFVLRDRRAGARTLRSVAMFAVGGGPLDPDLRRRVEDKLRGLGIQP
jgi:hypothetical protein